MDMKDKAYGEGAGCAPRPEKVRVRVTDGERGQARELLCVLGQAGQVPGEGMRAWKKASGGAGCLATGRGPCVETADIIPGRGLPVKRAAPGKGEDGIWE